jgi:hypothetical protein
VELRSHIDVAGGGSVLPLLSWLPSIYRVSNLGALWHLSEIYGKIESEAVVAQGTIKNDVNGNSVWRRTEKKADCS